MISEEKKNFISVNKDSIRVIVEKANARRSRDGIDILTEEEIGEGIDEMMALVKEGGNIRKYRFPSPEKKPESVPAKQEKKHGAFRFEVVKCSNGYLLNIEGSDSFIFKTPNELSEILGKIIDVN